MLTLLLMVAAGAQPKEVTLAAPGLTYVGVSQLRGDVYLDYFAQQVAKRGVHVITRKDVVAVIGIERQKQLLGCSEDQSSCLAELSGALGVSALLVGSIANAGSGFVVNLKVLDPSGSMRALAVFSERVGSEDALYEMLERSAAELSVLLKPAPPSSARGLAWLPMTAGLVACAAGGVLFGVAKGTEGAVAKGDASITSLVDARSRLETALGLQTGAFISFGVGFAALLVAGGMALFGDAPASPAVTLQLGPAGAGFLFSWVLP